MTKKSRVLMSKKVIIVRGKGVYDTLQEASESVGKSVSTLSRALRDFSPDIRQVDRVYLIKVRDIGWRVGVLSSTNSAYLPVDQDGEKVSAKKVEERKDITLAWYGMEFVVGDCR